MNLTIDTHHHFLPDFFYRETNDVHAPVGGLAPMAWTQETSLSFMDDAGIDIAVLSVSTPGVHTGDGQKAKSLARRCNEYLAEMIQQRPDRFAGFACLPLPDVDNSLNELTYALDELNLDGVVAFTNANGVYLGDPDLEELFQELERRKCTVYVHPNASPDPSAHALGLPDNLIDFTTDTNRVVSQMHYTNRFARTPNVRYIFSHAGGSIPYMAARFAIIDEMGFVPGGDERGSAADMFRRMFRDTALSVSDPVLQMLHDVAGAEQISFGTDFPYIQRGIGVKYKDRINNSERLSDSDKRGVFGNNAIKLFPRLNSTRKSAVAMS